MFGTLWLREVTIVGLFRWMINTHCSFPSHPPELTNPDAGDAHHLVQPEPSGDGAFRSMLAAIRDAGLKNLDEVRSRFPPH